MSKTVCIMSYSLWSVLCDLQAVLCKADIYVDSCVSMLMCVCLCWRVCIYVDRCLLMLIWPGCLHAWLQWRHLSIFLSGRFVLSDASAAAAAVATECCSIQLSVVSVYNSLSCYCRCGVEWMHCMCWMLAAEEHGTSVCRIVYLSCPSSRWRASVQVCSLYNVLYQLAHLCQ